MDGDLTSWSIGGPPSSSLLASVGLLGTPQGISGSHNKYESDASPTRPDLYEYGNDYKVIVPQFQQLFSMQPDAATANYDLGAFYPLLARRMTDPPFRCSHRFSLKSIRPVHCQQSLLLQWPIHWCPRPACCLYLHLPVYVQQVSGIS